MVDCMKPVATAVLLLSLTSCANVHFERDTETSGTFKSTGFSMTFFSFDIPKGALNIARENASDARQPNMVVERTRVVPDWGRLNWLLDIFSFRYASISGTWGFRLLILPGAAALWPLLLLRWLRAKGGESAR